VLLVAALLSVVIGVVLGMLGGGGAILTVPMLVYIVGLPPKDSIATSLFVVGVTSAVSVVVRVRSDVVRWRIGVAFGSAAMLGAFAGGRVAAWLPASVLLLVFATLMISSAIAMLRRASPPMGEREPASGTLAIARVTALGGLVGLLSGLVGSGGGFLIVPALALIGRLSIRESIGTSLFVIALQSFAGFAGHLSHAELDWQLTSVVTAGCVAGALLGGWLGRRLPAGALRSGFAWLVLAMGFFVFERELPLPVTVGLGMLSLAVLFLVTRKRPR
jgi:uncharacterized membrane protein YfcA